MEWVLPIELVFLLSSLAGMLLLAGTLHLLARLGPSGMALCDILAKAPALDVVVFLFCHGPWVAGWLVWWQATPRTVFMGGVGGFFAYLGLAIAAQVLSLFIWSWLHELASPKARKGPRIVSTLNRRVGWFRNHAAVWWTALAVPVFTLIRIAELIVYPPLHWLVRLPKYRHQDWINVSRQKFTGLVGYDLIWCLYCDWMTGVWSLGSEMLRNVESFWCPIRFSSPEKCTNCQIDFPDVTQAWVPPSPEGDMAQVAQWLERQYPGPQGSNSWAGHPERKVGLTHNGKPVSSHTK